MTPMALRRFAVAAWLASLGAAAHPATALDLFVRKPRATAPALGRVEVEVEVLSARRVDQVIVTVDGREVARRTDPPWLFQVDVGDENRAHRFAITARDELGEEASAVVETPALAVDFTLDLALQQLYVTVERDGRRVLDLPREAFAVFDESDRQTLVTFERGDVPLAAVVLVDTSLSMRGEALATALAGAEEFLAGMRPLDLAQVSLFSDRELAATPFADDPRGAAAALAGVEAEGGTALNDHLYLALQRLAARQGRRVVLVLSDGVDIHSLLESADVRWAARRSQALIYWLRLPGPVEPSSAWRDRNEHARELAGLIATVEESGGRIVPVADPAAIAGAFREILAELRDQYVLGYYPTLDRDDGIWHKVKVEVHNPTLKVRTRDGYLDEAP